MTEQAPVAPTTDEVAQPAPNVQEMTPEQMDSLKHALIQNLMKVYHTFIQSINSLPVALVPMQYSFKYFDTGLLWFKEAILNMPVQNLQVMEAPQSEAASPETAPQDTQGSPEEAATAPKEEVAPIVA